MQEYLQLCNILILSLGSVTLRSMRDTSSSGATCPKATIHCIAENLPSVVFSWFFDDNIVADYRFRPNNKIAYPLLLQPLSSIAGLDAVEILNASFGDTRDDGNFESVLRADLSLLKEAGVTNINCGSFGTMSNEAFTLNFPIGEIPYRTASL